MSNKTAMRDQIKNNIDNPERLEELYRQNKKIFESEFFSIYDEISSTQLARFWHARLNAEKTNYTGLNANEIIKTVTFMIIVSAIILLPKLFGFSSDDIKFYEKNIGITALFGVSLYTIFLKKYYTLKKLLGTVIIFTASAIYINILPINPNSSSIILIYIHLPLLLWFIFGLVYIDFDLKKLSNRIEFIKFNGDMAVLYGIFAIAGMILTTFTIGLFSAIGANIEKYYIEFIVIPGIVSVPIICSYLIHKFDYLSNKITPLVANIFSPLVLVTLAVYLISIAMKGSNPFIDRDFLIVFNGMLVGVVALITFSITEKMNFVGIRYYSISFLLLVIIAILVNLIALSAIAYRIAEYGITPNRLAVVGSNLLFLIHIILLFINLIGILRKKKELSAIELTTAKYLPVYGIWLVFVVFLMPLLFNFR